MTYTSELNLDALESASLSARLRAARFDTIKTKANAAKRLFSVLQQYAKDFGYPDGEVFIRSPEESNGNGWQVCFEGGPYQWAMEASWLVCNEEAGWYTEPYYSFDLCFTS